MANFPPPPPFGGGFMHGQPPFPPPPPGSQPNGYGINPQFPYLQPPRQQPFGQGPPPPMQHQYPNANAFGQNQYHHVAPPQSYPPSHVQPQPQNYYPFQQYQSNGPPLPFSQGQAHGMNASYNPMQMHTMPASGPSKPTTPQLYPTATQSEHRSVNLFSAPDNIQTVAAPAFQSTLENQVRNQGGGNMGRVEAPDTSVSTESDAPMPALSPQEGSVTADVPSNLKESESNSQTSAPPKEKGISTSGPGIAQLDGAVLSAPPTRPQKSEQTYTLNLPGLGEPDVQMEEATNNSAIDAEPFFRQKQVASDNRSVWLEKKAQARAALLELVGGGITHTQIANEGIDLDIIELLTPIQPTQQNATDKVTSPMLTAPRTTVAALASGAASGRQALQSPDPNTQRDESSLEPGEVSESEETSNARPSLQASGAVSKELSSSHPTMSDLPRKGEERKDYIARLLAAKHAVSKTSSSNAVADSTTTAQPISATESHGKPSVSQQQPLSKVGTVLSKQPTKPEAKDPVQTELVRQRLEALKSMRSNQQVKSAAQPAKPVSGASDGRPTVSTATRHPTQPSRSHSFYADSEKQLFEGLPGLSPVTQSRASQAEQFFNELAANQEQPSSGTDSEAVYEQQAITPLDRSHANSDGVSQRKRALASDFIDSPPNRKRRAGPEGLIELVIDVSDDEGEITHEQRSETFEGESLHDLVGAPKATEVGALRDKPPLSNFPFADSPIARPASPVQTPKSLTELEAQIAAHKERIAAAERNKKAVRTGSTPIANTVTVSAMNSGEATPSKIVDGQTFTDEKSQQLKQHQRSLAASKERLREKLEAERRTHALITARAEQELREAASATTKSEREQRLQRKAILEASLPRLDASIESARERVDRIRQQQEDLQAEIDRDLKNRQDLLDELNALLAITLESEPKKTPVEADKQNEKDPTVEVTAKQPTETIEQGLAGSAPLLGTSAENLDENQQSAHAGTELEDGPQEDEMDISGSSEHRNTDQEDVGDEAEDEDNDSLFKANGESNPSATPAIGPTEAKALSSDEGMETATPDEYDPSLDERFSDDDERLDNDSAQLDGEPGLYPEPSSDPADDSERDVDEQVISHNLATTEDPFEDNGDTSVSQSPFEEDVPDHQPRAETTDESTQRMDTALVYEPEEGEVSDPMGVSDDYEPPEEGEVSDDINAPDDYEPPGEPRNVDNVSDPNTTAFARPVPAPAAPQGSVEGFGAVSAIPTASQSGAVGQEDTSNKESSEESFDHFTPYESPLTRFHSYRFHPQYVQNISGGFSSLTFSHNIQTSQPLCRWELAGGICNAPSCEFQHFRDFPSTGNKILHELGSVMEGKTPEEQEQYKSGLKELLASMRDRGLNDPSAVASDIVAYRSRFLNDPTRVITNI